MRQALRSSSMSVTSALGQGQLDSQKEQYSPSIYRLIYSKTTNNFYIMISEYNQLHLSALIQIIYITLPSMSFMESSLKQPNGNPNSTNAVGHTGMVENLVRQADKDLQEYHKLIQLFRQQLQSMRNKIQNNNSEILDTTRPLVESLYRTLELGMVNQKEENTNFQDQLTELKKEKSILNQMIVATSKRSEQLGHQVGFY